MNKKCKFKFCWSVNFSRKSTVIWLNKKKKFEAVFLWQHYFCYLITFNPFCWQWGPQTVTHVGNSTSLFPELLLPDKGRCVSKEAQNSLGLSEFDLCCIIPSVLALMRSALAGCVHSWCCLCQQGREDDPGSTVRLSVYSKPQNSAVSRCLQISACRDTDKVLSLWTMVCKSISSDLGNWITLHLSALPEQWKWPKSPGSFASIHMVNAGLKF